jgi:glycosyltransferase involved in cell wall biosynthesis
VDRLKPHDGLGKAFIYFGRLSPEKGLTTFIRALKLAGVKGWIVGTGPEEDALRNLATEMGADVEFLGYLSSEALFDAVRRARAMVLPSEWYENAPLSVMESYALGRPVIGADIGGIPELIRKGETGEVFPSGNAEALAERIGRFAAMPDRQVLVMGKAGRAWMSESFTSQCYRDRVLSLYRGIGVSTD